MSREEYREIMAHIIMLEKVICKYINLDIKIYDEGLEITREAIKKELR